MTTRIQLRRDSSANWTSYNPTLAEGEIGLELDTNKFKIGTGTTAWNDLDYASASINAIAPLAYAEETEELTLNYGSGLTSSSGTLTVDFGTVSGKVVQGDDSRLSDARTPTAHKTTHYTGGSDALTAADIGAATSGHNHSGTYEPSGTVSSAITAHESASDPHPTYLTSTEGNAAYDPLGTASSIVSAHSIANDPHGDRANAASTYIPLTAIGTTVASLSDGKIPTNQLPAIAITDAFVVNSQSAMLALTAETGDIAIRTDLNKSFILSTNSPSTLSDWKELLTPTDAVLSVDGRTGAVSLSDLYDPLGTASSLVTAHGTTTTSVHGIVDTANLVTLAGTQTLTNKTISAANLGTPSFISLNNASGTIANSVTSGTSTSTANTLVLRDGNSNFAAGTITANLIGNALTATALQTARTINGTPFDGTSNIIVEPSITTQIKWGLV